MNKRYFWIKLKEDFFDSEEMDWVHEQPNGAEYIYIYLRLCLMGANNDGVVERKVGPLVMPYDIKKLAEMVKSTPDAVAVAITIFKRIGLVEEAESGALFIPGLIGMVGSESESASRVRKHRAKKAAEELPQPLQCNDSLLQSNENVTKNVTTENRYKRLDTRDKKDIEVDSQKPKTRRFSVHDAIDHLICGDSLKEALHAWAIMRKDDLKKPVGKQALAIGLNKLRELCGHDEAAMVEVVNQSTFKDWAGFFPLKDKKGPASSEADRREEVRKAVEKGSW